MDIVRKLAVKMSRRRILWETVALESPGAALGSATELLEDAETARTEFPPRSSFDPIVEGLQDACNNFRRDLEAGGTNFPFGDALHDLRVAALAFAERAATEFKMFEAERLAEKIDLDTSRSPLGLEGGTVYVLPPPDSPAYPNLTTQANEEDQASDLDKTPEEE